jgi:MerR family transcriptional regulator, thiopeptide resistance regulator
MEQSSKLRDTNGPPPPWKVGELARRTGLTVRTIHHYDVIGLLTPSRRTSGGHRLYSDDDVARLQQIHALRTLGLPLADIRSLLSAAASAGVSRPSPLALINAHRTQLRARIEAEGIVLAKLDAIAEHLGAVAHPSVSVLCTLLQQMTALQRVERHFTPQQRAELAVNLATLGSEHSRRVVDRWQTLIPAVADAIAARIQPESVHAQELAAEWRALLALSTGHAADVAHAARNMYEADGDALADIMPQRPTTVMFEFIADAGRAEADGRAQPSLQRRRRK